MDFEKKKKNNSYQICDPVGKEPQHSHENKHGHFHDHPADFVHYGFAPFPVVKPTITHIHKLQNYEYHDREQGHWKEKQVEDLLHGKFSLFEVAE